jgi:hypothetical protein
MNEKLLNKLIKKATKETKFQHEMGGFYHEDVFTQTFDQVRANSML